MMIMPLFFTCAAAMADLRDRLPAFLHLESHKFVANQTTNQLQLANGLDAGMMRMQTVGPDAGSSI